MNQINKIRNLLWSIPCKNWRSEAGLRWSRSKLEELKNTQFLVWDFSKVESLPEENSPFVLFRTDSDVRGVVGYGQIKNVNSKDKTVELHFYKHLKVIKHRPLYSEINWAKEVPNLIPETTPVLINDQITIQKIEEKTKILKTLLKKYEEETLPEEIDLTDVNTKDLRNEQNQRSGQQQLKNKLIDLFGSCEVTGISNKELLIASHIKPWSKFKEDKGSLANCLLLCSALDSLFDKGLITFDSNGKILISSSLDSKIWAHYGLNKQLQLNLSSREKMGNSFKDKTLFNLEYHRNYIFKK